MTIAEATSAAAAVINEYGSELLVLVPAYTKSPTGGTKTTFTTGHTYAKGFLYTETTRGQEKPMGGRTEATKQLRASVIKDSYSPAEWEKCRLQQGGVTYEITGTNAEAVDDYVLVFEIRKVA